MDKSAIKIIRAIVHILDSQSGTPILSDAMPDFGSDFSDFIRTHIHRVITGDDTKKCKFMEESEVLKAICDKPMEEADVFAIASKDIASHLFGIMYSNIDIPSADLVVVLFSVNDVMMLAILKMNYKTSYTHNTYVDGDCTVNNLTMNRALLPQESQKLTEAAVINLSDMNVRIVERKYDVNGAKVNYFSELFMKCTTKLSQKAKLDIVTKAVEQVQKEYVSERDQFEEKMKVKSIIHDKLLNEGEINIPVVAEKIFENKPEMKEKFKEKIDKYHISETEPIIPQSESTKKKFDKQNLVTDTGIEIKIPMEQYNSTESIEFITNMDGTISVLIKNISNISSK